MRFKTQIRNVSVFSKFCASLASLDALALCRLTDEDVQFTVIPDKGSQMWSSLKLDTVFENYIIQSAAEKNTINLEVPIQALQRALKSALNATSVQIRLTKKDNVPMLSLTIVTNSITSGNGVVAPGSSARISDEYGDFDLAEDIEGFGDGSVITGRERETLITQDVPVKVLAQQTVAHLHEPITPPSDVNIFLPSLAQVKSVSERFTKLALATTKSSTSTAAPRLELSANMHGTFKIAITTDALSISSKWTGLTHPELEPSMFENGSQGVRDDPSTKKKELGGADGQNPAGWTTVRIDGKDFNRVLSVGRLNSRVIATFIPEHGLVLYVYLPNDENPAEESVLTYYISSFSA
ncbi:Checkpoint protein hus1 [Cyphellophora attinorum]|uniref:Checkpoint protein n=1 Tax=Cyphellophora attinorum TaxID=1664694 RepID=A0A0N1HC41_9EURO|nr:Checkpoint protein hus1 [Phialophora attinorum]KPI41782.1 Checkpoint protein hus1 [Phialophora attinorum]